MNVIELVIFSLNEKTPKNIKFIKFIEVINDEY